MIKKNILFLPLMVIRLHGVEVSTKDFESFDPSSNLGGALLFYFSIKVFGHDLNQKIETALVAYLPLNLNQHEK